MKSLPIILLHGWGFSSRIWQPLLQALAVRDCTQVFCLDLPGFGSAFHEHANSNDAVLQYLVEQLPERCVLGGWSLGGMLATQLAAKHPERVAGLITLGSNLYFTADDGWPGMPRQDFQQFCQRFDNQPEKTWQRFLGLQTRGDADCERTNALINTLVDFQDCNAHTATKMLKLLGEIDNRAIFSVLPMPSLHVLGDADAITPAAIAPQLSVMNAQQTTVVLSHSSHAMPVSHAETIADHILQFLQQPSAAISNNSPKKSHIANSFSRAATSYNQAAQLQKIVGEALLATLPDDLQGTALDFGCGTGFISAALQKKHPALRVIGVDLASGMLQTAQQTHAITAVQADMEQLPFATQSTDHLISNLALQWADDLTQCFTEWRRTLKPQGTLRFTTFLPNTLQELKTSWQAVDDAVHVNTFMTQEKIVGALQQAGFSSIETFSAAHVLYYDQLQDLARELKAIGAHNMNSGRPQGLTGKNRWATLITAYEMLRTERGLPATYEVLYVTAA
ncbi:MAG: malonyl-ACP O-methyltransferase BioC [Pseudomonadales bacterium]